MPARSGAGHAGDLGGWPLSARDGAHLGPAGEVEDTAAAVGVGEEVTAMCVRRSAGEKGTAVAHQMGARPGPVNAGSSLAVVPPPARREPKGEAVVPGRTRARADSPWSGSRRAISSSVSCAAAPAAYRSRGQRRSLAVRGRRGLRCVSASTSARNVARSSAQ